MLDAKAGVGGVGMAIAEVVWANGKMSDHESVRSGGTIRQLDPAT
jgi:hypothetical protein